MCWLGWCSTNQWFLFWGVAKLVRQQAVNLSMRRFESYSPSCLLVHGVRDLREEERWDLVSKACDDALLEEGFDPLFFSKGPEPVLELYSIDGKVWELYEIQDNDTDERVDPDALDGL